jgi:hypothetical protein
MRKFKKIRVMPDFCSSGIWDGTTGVMIDYRDLKLPPKLIKEFEHWVNVMYDRPNYKKNYSGLKKSAVMPVYWQGLYLAGEIKNLFPKTEVEYWSEMEHCKIKKIKVK